MIEAMHVHRLSDGRVEVQLDPPELGRVEISFEFSDDGLRASLASERAGTAELVRRHADMLLQQLRAAGFENATLDFGERAERHPPAERRDAEEKAAPSGSLTTDLLPDMRVETARKGLDLRL
ncbi:MAG: flagellar hook-length control protein FliK [Pseudomonadota bacterium]